MIEEKYIENNKSSIKVLLKREFLYVALNNIYKYVIVAIFFLFASTVIAWAMRIEGNCNSFGLIFEILCGQGYFRVGEPFRIPMLWLITNIFVLYIVLDYVQKDFKSNGIYTITRCGRRKYWICKLIMSTVIVITYYIMVFGIIFVVGKILLIDGNKIDFSIVILYVTTSLALVILLNVIALFTQFKYSFLIIMVLLVSSLFYDSFLMPGQHSLILRHVPYDIEHNLTNLKSIIYNASIIVFSGGIGFYFVKKKDIL